MFHAVNQMPGAEEDDDDIISPGVRASVVPMFHDSSLSKNNSSKIGRGEASRLSQGNNNSGTSANSMSSVIASVGGGVADGGPVVRVGARRAPWRALRSRRGGGGAIEMSTVNNHQAFAGPDGLDSGFAEGGTFRWNATVADAATGQEEEMDDKEEEGAGLQEQVGGRGALAGRCWRLLRSPPTAGEMGSVRGRRKPWYVMMPESRMHQVFDHLGELASLLALLCANGTIIEPSDALVEQGQWQCSSPWSEGCKHMCLIALDDRAVPLLGLAAEGDICACVMCWLSG